jgi:hypothetical protein
MAIGYIYGHLVYFWLFSAVLISITEKNLATLIGNLTQRNIFFLVERFSASLPPLSFQERNFRKTDFEKNEKN